MGNLNVHVFLKPHVMILMLIQLLVWKHEMNSFYISSMDVCWNVWRIFVHSYSTYLAH